jgi:hypothetical protein
MIKRLIRDSSSKTVINRKIINWWILLILGIIGSGLSLLMIPGSPILFIMGFILFLMGLYVFHNAPFDPYKIKQKHLVGFSLIFTGFLFAWLFVWLVSIYYFRFSNSLFAIYL